MLEVLGLVFTSLATIWARKQDIAAYVNDPNSHPKIRESILLPAPRFSAAIMKISSSIDSLLESGYRFYFSLFMLSLLYTSASFIFSLNFIGSKSILFDKSLDVNDARLAFLLYAISMPITFLVGRTHNVHMKSSAVSAGNSSKAVTRLKRINGVRSRAYYFICAAIFTVFVYVVYSSLLLTFFSGGISMLAAYFNCYLFPFFLVRKFSFRIYVGGCLGALGLVIVALSFASKTMGTMDYIIIILISNISGFLACVSNINSITVADFSFRDHYRFLGKAGLSSSLSAIGKPALFVALHCIRASGPFCAAVSVILLNVAVSRQFMPEALVNAGAIMLACFVFFSGATTIAGAGIFAFGTVALIGVYMSFFPRLLFSTWGSVFMLWILLPFINSFADFIRWSIARNNMKTFAKSARMNMSLAIYLDVFIAFISYIFYVFSVFFSVSIFESISLRLGYYPIFDVKYISSRIDDDLFSNGLWLLVMAGTIMIPTLVQIIVFLYSGFIFVFSRRYRRKLSVDLSKVGSVLEKDILAWQIAALDVMSRVIFAVAAAVVLLLLLINMAPIIQKLTSIFMHYGISSGNSVTSWFLAS